MMVMISIPSLDQYSHLVDQEILEEIADLAQALSGLHITHINTTAKGGGVAEILESLMGFFEDFPIKHRWEIVEIDSSSGPFVARLIDQLQGGDPGQLSQEEQEQFHRSLLHSARHLQQHHADIYFVHDLQLAPLAKLLPSLRPAIWFCHMDITTPNKETEKYISQFLENYSLCVFNTSQSLLSNIAAEHIHIINPSIDPFKTKNQDLQKANAMRILTRCGIDTSRPLITQVSRFDRWKNPWQAIDIYRLVKQEIPDVQLALLGAMDATDDHTAHTVLADVETYAQADPDIHLLSDPQLIGPDEVNAFQRYSSVLVQRSLREGFGLTATEAMWKKQPILGTSATGLRAQIVDQETGYIVDATEACAERAIELIRSPEVRYQLGMQAHEHVKKHFLLPMMALSYLRAVTRVVIREQECFQLEK